MPTVVTSSSLTLTNVEQTVGAQQTAAGIYILDVDLFNMLNGDVVELLIYKTVLTSGGTERVLERVNFPNAQGKPVTPTAAIAIVTGQTLTFKMRQPTGTGRVVPFTLMTI